MFSYCNNDPTGMVDDGGSRPLAMSDTVESAEDQMIAAKINSEAHRRTASAATGGTKSRPSLIDSESPPPSSVGYKRPENPDKAKKKVSAPGARGKTGWLDDKGRVWVPDTNMDGGEGWRRHYPDGSHDHVYPDGKVRTHKSHYYEHYWDTPSQEFSSSAYVDEFSTIAGITGTTLETYLILSAGLLVY